MKVYCGIWQSKLIGAGLAGIAVGLASYGHAAPPVAPSPAIAPATNPIAIEVATTARSLDTRSEPPFQKALDLVRDRQMHCQVTNAAYRHDSVEQLEFSCKEGLGYVLTPIGSDFGAADCVMAQGYIGQCRLRENMRPASGLRQYVDEAGGDCDPQKARFVGSVNKMRMTRFEVRCASGEGLILDVPFFELNGSSQELLHEPAYKAAIYNCLQAPEFCKLSSYKQNVIALSTKIKSDLDIACDAAEARYIGHAESSKAELYEFKCNSTKDSSIITFGSNDILIASAPCNSVHLSGAECKLSSTIRR